MDYGKQQLLQALRERPPELLAIGGSAGSIDALLRLLPRLPAECACAVVVVVHMAADRDSLLAQLLARVSALPVVEAEPWLEVAPGRIYLAPPDYHLGVEPDRTFSLSAEPPVNYARPAIDLLFATVADVYGPAAFGILLTGANRDGAAGLAALGAAGGLTLVEDPASAQRPEMPQAALERLRPDAVLALPAIGEILTNVPRRHGE